MGWWRWLTGNDGSATATCDEGAGLSIPVSMVAETVDLAIAPRSVGVWAGDVPYAAIELSEAFEGRRLKPYDDGYGFWTIGIGSTTDLKGNKVTKATQPITDREAELMAMRDLEKAARLVKLAITSSLTNRQAAALILLANNVGSLSVAAPTLVNLVNARNWRAAAEQFKAYRNSAGKPSLGLRCRRWTEAAYSLGLDAQVARKRAWVEITTVDGWPKLPT
jgi:lysozyme